MGDLIMNQRLRFSWGHIIAFIALIAVSYVSFVGYTYLSNGNFIFGVVGMGVTDILFIFVFIGAQQLKASDFKMSKKIVWERVLVFGSPLVFVAGMISMSHFWTVHSRNDEIVSDFNNSLIHGRSIFDDYEQYANERIASYDANLQKVIAEKKSKPTVFRNAGFTEGMEEMQKDNMVDVLRLQLLSSNYDSLKNLAVTWIERANNGASTFNVFLLGNTREIRDALIAWENQLKGFTTKKLSNEQFFGPVADFNTNAGQAAAREIDSLGQSFVSQKIPTMSAVIFGIVIYLMLIFPYFIQERHSKSVYGLGLGKKKKSKDSATTEDFDDSDDGIIEEKYQEDDDFPSF